MSFACIFHVHVHFLLGGIRKLIKFCFQDSIIVASIFFFLSIWTSVKETHIKNYTAQKQFPANLVTFTEEILNGKLHFLCSAIKNTKSLKTCNFIKKETLAHVFSCEFCKISKNNFLYGTPQLAASGVIFTRARLENLRWRRPA